jgi:DNA ligase-1
MDDLALACERVASWSSRLRKVAILAEYLKPLPDIDLARAVRFLCCGPIQSQDRKFSVGGATLREAAIAASGFDAEVYATCNREVGDTGETIGLLLHGRTRNEPMSLADAELLYARLYKMRRTADKVDALREVFCRYRPVTLKYFVKVITGNLRIGLQYKQVEEALAVATGQPLGEIRHASNCTGDLPVVATAARQGRLYELEARLFHPMDFMLAKPLDRLDDLQDPENYYIEDKYDGFRSQIHSENGRVMIFTRGMEEVTNAFPEIAEAVGTLRRSMVVDGEIVAWQDGRPMSFNVLQQRIARKKLTPELMAEVPVAFVAYDLLYLDGGMVAEVEIEERRGLLAGVAEAERHPLYLAPQWTAETIDGVDRLFAESRERGNEGLILKRKGSLYEAGKRSGAWLKLKRPYATLDVVVTAAEQGHGRRAIWLSDYTFGVRDGERFVNVGKAYSGLTDAEIRELTRIFRAAAIERFGRVVLVQPEVVLEVAFDLIQKSSRHKGGYALRFPRIVRWRRDKTPAEADTLERVRELYEASLRR